MRYNRFIISHSFFCIGGGRVAIQLSVYIITYNEEVRLPRTLAAARQVADEIVVVDCGSTDTTCGIARSFGARCEFNAWVSFGDQVRVAEQLCSNDWVLRLDADEEMTPELIAEIKEIKNKPDCDGYRLRIGDVFPGVERPLRAVRHFRLIRLYNRTKMRMMGVLDRDDVDMCVPNARVRTLRSFICHRTHLSLTKTLDKQNRATDTQLRMLIKANKRYYPWRMVGCSTLTFLKYFVLYRHFLYGFWGFINCTCIAFTRFMKFAKFYEHDQKMKYPDSLT